MPELAVRQCASLGAGILMQVTVEACWERASSLQPAAYQGAPTYIQYETKNLTLSIRLLWNLLLYHGSGMLKLLNFIVSASHED